VKATSIPKHETSFRQTGLDSAGKKHVLSPFTVTVPSTRRKLRMVSCRMQSGDESFFYKETAKKDRIVLHYTAGYLKGDIATLTTIGNHVSVPFVIARDGTIYNLWASKYWSYHLGPGAQGGNTLMSKTSVAIELSNIGWLRRIGGRLVTYFGNSDVYCTTAEGRYYVQIPPYREQSYFATFTDEQYVSVTALLMYLTDTYQIPRVFLSGTERYDVLDTVDSFRGVTSHVNYRATEKWDIGPAFDWDRVMSAVAPG
jgi:N-acetyl-anhydromuramyl-L-alanine amidase AmpD